MDLFIGTEIEGNKKGIKTLFVGDIPIIDIKKIINFLIDQKINRIYFGADNYRRLPDNFNYFVELCPDNISIVAEIKNPTDAIRHNKRVDFVLYIDIDNIQEIKTIQDKKLTWTRLTDMQSWVNYIDDFIYTRDEEIII